ncbi:hypothetical protein, partial [Thiolapillus sp.]|uniref:hypothetical protein n=1 Tax=Thiolapillus sp. TaxID=2017437 RepID=UPI003AF8EF1F
NHGGLRNGPVGELFVIILSVVLCEAPVTTEEFVLACERRINPKVFHRITNVDPAMGYRGCSI